MIYVFILAAVSIIHLSEQIFSHTAACITTPNGKAGKSHFVSIKNQYVWINRVEMKEQWIDIMRERGRVNVISAQLYCENLVL